MSYIQIDFSFDNFIYNIIGEEIPLDPSTGTYRIFVCTTLWNKKLKSLSCKIKDCIILQLVTYKQISEVSIYSFIL